MHKFPGLYVSVWRTFGSLKNSARGPIRKTILRMSVTLANPETRCTTIKLPFTEPLSRLIPI